KAREALEIVSGEKVEAEIKAREATEKELQAEKKTQETRDNLIAEFQYAEAIRRVWQFRDAGSDEQAHAVLVATDPNRRGWEWNYLAQQFPRILRGNSSDVSSVSFSPDGRRLASGSKDGNVRVWDLAGGGDPLVLKGHSDT